MKIYNTEIYISSSGAKVCLDFSPVASVLLEFYSFPA
jgi:hypothetical protein